MSNNVTEFKKMLHELGILKISGFFVAKFFEVVEHKNRVS